MSGQRQTDGRLGAQEMAAWRGFLRAHSSLVRQLDGELSATQELPLRSYEVLLLLDEAPGRRLRMSDLSRSVLLSPSGVTRLVDRLEHESLVHRERCAEDGRGCFAVLTESGRRRLHAARATHLAGVRRLFLDRFTDDELRRLAGYWERVAPGAVGSNDEWRRTEPDADAATCRESSADA